MRPSETFNDAIDVAVGRAVAGLTGSYAGSA